MGELFFNKVAGSLLAVFLVIMGLGTLADTIYHTETPEEPAYPIDMSALTAGAGAAAEEEEGPVDFGLLLASADIGAGERTARRCAACHTFDEGGADGTGPHLWGVMGRAVAGVAGFGYSGAMVEYGADGKAWSYQNMYDYLENPRSYVSGTAMSFAGLRKQEDRINIIAYMRSLSNSPIALPEPLPVADDVAEAVEAVGGELAAEGDAVDAQIAEAVDGAEASAAEAGDGAEEEGRGLLEAIVDTAEAVVDETVETAGEVASGTGEVLEEVGEAIGVVEDDDGEAAAEDDAPAEDGAEDDTEN